MGTVFYMSGHTRESSAPAQLHIGTSGWSYKHWREVFYPADIPVSRWLEFYATRFSTVEINNSFYRLPRREVFESWRDTTGPEFIFAVKASRYITHVKKLNNVEDAWGRFIENARGLGEKLGPILFQFPANWHANAERLRYFLQLLPDTHRYAFEFRHASWFTDTTYMMLKEKGAALCIADSPLWPLSTEITAPFTFLRMHGGRELYASEYSPSELLHWAEVISSFLEKRIHVLIYFNNDAFGYAAKNALQLRELLMR